MTAPLTLSRFNAVQKGAAGMKAAATGLLVVMAAIAGFLIWKAIPAFTNNTGNLFTTQTWNPQGDPPVFGMAAVFFPDGENGYRTVPIVRMPEHERETRGRRLRQRLLLRHFRATDQGREDELAVRTVAVTRNIAILRALLALGLVYVVVERFGVTVKSSAVVESAFGLSGMGSLLVQSVDRQDFAIVQAIVLIVVSACIGLGYSIRAIANAVMPAENMLTSISKPGLILPSQILSRCFIR